MRFTLGVLLTGPHSLLPSSLLKQLRVNALFICPLQSLKGYSEHTLCPCWARVAHFHARSWCKSGVINKLSKTASTAHSTSCDQTLPMLLFPVLFVSIPQWRHGKCCGPLNKHISLITVLKYPHIPERERLCTQ